MFVNHRLEKVLHSEYVRNFKTANDKMLRRRTDLCARGWGVGGETRKGQHLGVFRVMDVACVLVVVVITGISPCHSSEHSTPKDKQARNSLVVQWLRMRLPCKINTQKPLHSYKLIRKNQKE